MTRLNSSFLGLIMICIIVSSCEEVSVPKPLGFMRINLIEQEYNPILIEDVVSFDLSDQCKIEELAKTDKAMRFNIVYPAHNAKIHLVFNAIESNLGQHLEETRKLTYQHHEKANNIDKVKVAVPGHKVYGVKYNLTGDVASASQFFLTDSTDHFLRGALYFWSRPNEDSLAPAVNYIREDIDQLINSLTWK